MMSIQFHPHSRIRMKERGASEEEVKLTVETGEKFPTKFERIGFRRNFPFNGSWQGKICNTKQIEVYAVQEEEDFIILTVIVKYF